MVDWSKSPFELFRDLITINVEKVSNAFTPDQSSEVSDGLNPLEWISENYSPIFGFLPLTVETVKDELKYTGLLPNIDWDKLKWYVIGALLLVGLLIIVMILN